MPTKSQTWKSKTPPQTLDEALARMTPPKRLWLRLLHVRQQATKLREFIETRAPREWTPELGSVSGALRDAIKECSSTLAETAPLIDDTSRPLIDRRTTRVRAGLRRLGRLSSPYSNLMMLPIPKDLISQIARAADMLDEHIDDLGAINVSGTLATVNHKGIHQEFQSSWYAEHSGDYLNAETLRQALHKRRITGTHGKRNRYHLDSVCAAWPECAARLMAAAKA